MPWHCLSIACDREAYRQPVIILVVANWRGITACMAHVYTFGLNIDTFQLFSDYFQIGLDIGAGGVLARPFLR